MTSIKQLYLVDTNYGINLIAETNSGDWYQQQHTTLEMNGGGAADWVKLAVDENDQPAVLNKRYYDSGTNIANNG